MDPITALALLGVELTRAWVVWFQAQKPDVQQAGGDAMLEHLKHVDAFFGEEVKKRRTT